MLCARHDYIDDVVSQMGTEGHHHSWARSPQTFIYTVQFFPAWYGFGIPAPHTARLRDRDSAIQACLLLVVRARSDTQSANHSGFP